MSAGAVKLAESRSLQGLCGRPRIPFPWREERR